MKKPLIGKRILVTRAWEQSGEASGFLKELGAEVVAIPTIDFAPPTSFKGLDRAIERLSVYDWIIFTSANAVHFFMDRLAKRGKDLSDLYGIKLCAIGPKTTRTLGNYGLSVDVVPQEYMAEAIVKALGRKSIKGKRILLPRSKIAREVIPTELRSRGARVDVVEVYRTIVPKKGGDRIRFLLQEKKIHAITFTSSSTVKNFVEMVGKKKLPSLMKGVALASIGPVTAETMMKCGLVPHIVGSSLESMVSGLIEYLIASSSSRGHTQDTAR